jgi:hypothetical protein
MSMKNSSDTIGNRTRGLAVCSAVPQAAAPRKIWDPPQNSMRQKGDVTQVPYCGLTNIKRDLNKI